MAIAQIGHEFSLKSSHNDINGRSIHERGLMKNATNTVMSLNGAQCIYRPSAVLSYLDTFLLPGLEAMRFGVSAFHVVMTK